MILRKVIAVERAASGARIYLLDCGHREQRPADSAFPRARILCSRCVAAIAAKGEFGSGALR